MSETVIELLARNGVTVPENTLAHYGVPGMRWGKRKSNTPATLRVKDSQGRTGTVTAAPGVSKRELKRAVRKDPDLTTRNVPKPTSTISKPKAPNTLAARPKNRKMSDAELRAKVNRLQMEKQLRDLTAPTPKADKFAKQVMKEVGKQAVRTIATRAVSAGIEVALNKAAGRAAAGSVSKALLDQMVKGGGKKNK